MSEDGERWGKKPSHPVGVPRATLREEAAAARRKTPAFGFDAEDRERQSPIDDPFDPAVQFRKIVELQQCATQTQNELHELRSSQADLAGGVLEIKSQLASVPVLKWIGGAILAGLLSLGTYVVKRSIDSEHEAAELRRDVERHQALDAHPGTSKAMQDLDRDVARINEMLRAAQELDAAHQAEIERRLDRIETRRNR